MRVFCCFVYSFWLFFLFSCNNQALITDFIILWLTAWSRDLRLLGENWIPAGILRGWAFSKPLTLRLTWMILIMIMCTSFLGIHSYFGNDFFNHWRWLWRHYCFNWSYIGPVDLNPATLPIPNEMKVIFNVSIFCLYDSFILDILLYLSRLPLHP